MILEYVFIVLEKILKGRNFSCFISHQMYIITSSVSHKTGESNLSFGEKIKKVICISLIASVFLTGCAGRKPNPIAIYLPGDENRSCDDLKKEITLLQADMQRMLPKTNKEVTNALWATAGFFLIAPYFFMDLKDAEKTEFDAMRRRHNRLLMFAAKKNCDMSGMRAERIPSIEERKAAAKSQKEGKVINNKAIK